MVMSFGRKLLAWFLSAILTFLLFLFAIDVGFVRIAGSPNQIENILDKSGIYSSIVPGLLDQAKTIDSSNGDVPLNNSIVRQAATESLTPQYLSSNVNNALDSIYVWLNGKTTLPTFKINVAKVRLKFADQVAAGVKKRAAKLPVCNSVIYQGQFDAFKARCLPYGVTPTLAAANARASILSGKGFLDKPVITANDITSNGSKQSIFADQLKDTPQKFQDFKKTPGFLGFLIVLFAAAVVFSYTPRFKGLRHLGFLLAGSGIFILLFSLALNVAVSNKVLTKVSLNSPVFESSVRAAVKDVVHNLGSTYLVIGLIYIVLGALAAGAVHYYFVKNQLKSKAK